MADPPRIERTDHLIPVERREPQPPSTKYRPFDRVAQTMFLDELQKHGRKSFALKRLGCSPSAATCEAKRNEEFKELVANALDLYHDSLVVEATKRAVEGTDEPLVYKGELTGGSVKKKSDRLLEKLLEAQVQGFSKKVDIDQRVTGGVLIVSQPITNVDDWANKHDDAEEIEVEVTEPDQG